MQGRILIIDGISTNRIVLKVKLSAAFYHVTQAGSMAEALEMIRMDRPDLVVTAVNLPDGTAAGLCRALRAMHPAAALPVLAIADTPDREARITTLHAGATDVMDKPVNETLLLGRVRNMIRAEHRIAEWQFRDDASCALGLAEAPAEFVRPGTIALIGLEAGQLQGWVRQLLPHLNARYCVTLLRDAMASLHAKVPPEAVVLALPDTPTQSEDCLRLISALRASALTRDIALLVIQKTPDPARATSALDIGADDIMTAGFDAQELALRMQVLLRRKRHIAQMLQSVRTGLREVVHDPLTGLYNRRFAIPYMTRLMDQSSRTQSPFALVLADMDHFKRINDDYGHASGDAVLEETARRLCQAVRGTDMVARMGGEEFLIAMPDTDAATARGVANRLCRAVGAAPFVIPGARHPVAITISLGLAMGNLPLQLDRHSPEKVDEVLDRADKALYAAKIQGRNRFTQSHPESLPAA